jgi:hypothetical protein
MDGYSNGGVYLFKEPMWRAYPSSLKTLEAAGVRIHTCTCGGEHGEAAV